MAETGGSNIDITATDRQARRTIASFFRSVESQARRFSRNMENYNPASDMADSFDDLGDHLDDTFDDMEHRTRGFYDRWGNYHRRTTSTIGKAIRDLPEHLKPFHQSLDDTRKHLRSLNYVTVSLEEMSEAAVKSAVSIDKVGSVGKGGKAGIKIINELNRSVKETQLAILGLNRDGTVKISTQQTEERLRHFRGELEQTKEDLKKLRDAGDFASYEAGMTVVERKLRDVDAAMRAAARGGPQYTAMLQQLGVNTADAMNRAAIEMEAYKDTWIRNIQLMENRKGQAQKMLDIVPETSVIKRIDSFFLGIGNNIEKMAKRSTAAGIALRQLGENASMKDLQDRVMVINMGLMRTQMVAMAAGVALAGFTAVMFNAAKGPNVADVLQEQADAMQEYQDQLNQRTEQIESSWNIFEKVQLDKTSPAKLMSNLTGQVNALKQWNKNLSSIASRTSSDFANYLSNLGPEAAGQIAALNKMSDSELNKYVALWQEKHRLARTRATSELAQLKQATDQKIKELQNSLTPLGISLAKAQGAWAQALGPFIDIWGRVAAKILDASTALANFINRMNQANDDISQMGGMFLYIATALTLLLSPMAIGIGRAAGMAAAFGAIWMQAGPLILGLTRIIGIVSVLSAAIVIVVGSLMKMWGASENLRKSVFNAFTQIKQVVSSAIAPLVPALNRLKATVLAALNSMVGAKQAGSFWQALGDIFARVINFIVTALLPKFRAGLDAIVSFIVKIAPKIGAMVQAVAGFIKVLVSTVTNGNTVIGKIFRVAWTVIEFIIKGAWANIKGIVSSGIAIITNIFQLFTNLLQGNWKAAFGNIVAIVKNVFIFIWNYINLMALGRILGVFKSFFVGGIALFRSGFGKISFNVQYFMLAIREFIEKTYTRLTTATGNAFKSMLNWARSILGSMWAFIKSIFTTIYNFYANIMRRTYIAFSQGWSGVKSLTLSFLKAVWSFIQSYFKNIYNFYVNILRRIFVIFQSGWRGVYNVTMSIFKSVYSFLKSIFSSIYSTISGAVTKTRQWVSNGWNALWSQTKTIFGNIKNSITKTYGEIVDGAKKLPGRIGQGIKNMAGGVKGGAIALANTLAKALGTGINGAIGGLNWILGKIGVDKKIPKWPVPQYKKGTSEHPGGWFYAGDGGQEELIQFPDGRVTLSPATDTLYYGEKGTQVLSGPDTKKLLSTGLIPGYDSGVGTALKKKAQQLWGATKSAAGAVKDKAVSTTKKAKDLTLDVFEYMSKPKELIQKVFAKFVPTLPKVGGAYGSILKGSMSFVKDKAVSYIKKQLGEGLGGAFMGSGKVSGNVSSWIKQAIAVTGSPASWFGPLTTIAMKESGGRTGPSTVNKWDSNWRRGTPSMGLMQTIMPTFNSFKKPGFNDIMNPVHNAIAAINYIKKRYGTPFNTPGIRSMAHGGPYKGYKFGGIIDSPQIAALAENGKPEAVVPLVGRRMDPFAIGVAEKLGEIFNLGGVAQGNGSPYIFQVNLNGRKVAEEVFRDIDELQKRSETRS
ncbi:SLT domain-containing protein/phage-related protein/gas vesicle protein, partial [Priestia megaterium]|uniref:transglycosylase SLT domain-containing protein n=1 Tax=Priestia megaterium TaxID=1404 RepID=UPI003397D063